MKDPCKILAETGGKLCFVLVNKILVAGQEQLIVLVEYLLICLRTLNIERKLFTRIPLKWEELSFVLADGFHLWKNVFCSRTPFMCWRRARAIDRMRKSCQAKHFQSVAFPASIKNNLNSTRQGNQLESTMWDNLNFYGLKLQALLSNLTNLVDWELFYKKENKKSECVFNCCDKIRFESPYNRF